MSYVFFRNENYTEEKFLDEMNDIENELAFIADHRDVEEWRLESKINQKELDEMVALARELADIDLSDKSEEIREEILYNLSDIFMMYALQGKGLVNLDKLRAIADQLEEPLQEYLEEIL